MSSSLTFCVSDLSSSEYSALSASALDKKPGKGVIISSKICSDDFGSIENGTVSHSKLERNAGLRFWIYSRSCKIVSGPRIYSPLNKYHESSEISEELMRKSGHKAFGPRSSTSLAMPWI